MDISLVTTEKPVTVATTSTHSKKDFIPQRLYSLDALRGFDMFWIMGAEEIFHGFAKATGSSFWNALSAQFTHLPGTVFIFMI
jgi:hypothetical protein